MSWNASAPYQAKGKGGWSKFVGKGKDKYSKGKQAGASNRNASQCLAFT